MNSDNIFDQLLQKYHYGSDIGEILQSLDTLPKLQNQGELTAKERYELQVYAFRTLQELTINEPDKAEPIILNRLLPECVLQDEEAVVWLARHRDCLSDWLAQYPEQKRQSLQKKVVGILYSYFNLPTPQALCWTISNIGFRDEETLRSLWNLVEKENGEIGDIALSAIINLGIPSAQREAVRTELHRRVIERFGRFLVTCLVQFADPTSLKIVVDHWLAQGNEELQSIDLALAFVAVRDILDEHSHDPSLQDQTWQKLISLAQEKTKEFADAVYKRDLVNACNSPLVIPSMLERITEGLEQEENSSHWRYIAALTLENCIRPNQLEGWQGIAKQSLNWEILRQDACQDTGSDIFMTTTDHERKRAAWDILFRAKYLEALDWLDEAVVSETSRFLQQQIIGLFACFKIEPLPGFIKHWITERFDDQVVDGDSRELSRRTAAVRLARSATSQEAFDSLLNFGYTHKGQTLRGSSDALTEVSVFLVNEGNKEIESRLIETITTREEAHQSVAAAMALGHVVSLDGSSLSNQVERILPLLFDSDRQDFERGALLSALGRLPNWQVPGNVLQKIEEWAVEPNRWLAGSSLEVLAHHGILHERPELLKKSLGLIQINGQWGLAPDTNLTDWAPYFIGLLYKKYPESYLPAVVALLTNSTWFPIEIAIWLQDVYSSVQTVLPQEISQALVQRIYEKQSSTYSETDVFDLLAEIAPEALATQNWETVWDNWLQSARAGLADALGQLDLSPDLQVKAIEHLKLLALDSQYAVRRSAYRGLARQSQLALYTECLSWANPDKPTEENPVELRKRAAEAFGWLDTVERQISMVDLENLRQRLKTDVEKVVRDTIHRSEKERRQRLWAEQYLSIVLQVEGKSNEEIIDVWCYAEALAQVGDDTCIEALKKHLQKNLPPNVRYWINILIKSMKSNWQKVTDKWPDPWFTWDGIIEQGQGKAIISENEMIDIEYSVWQQRASQPSDTLKWGGAMWPVPYSQANKIKIIELENGAQGKILSTNMANERTIFSGQGYYPGTN